VSAWGGTTLRTRALRALAQRGHITGGAQPLLEIEDPDFGWAAVLQGETPSMRLLCHARSGSDTGAGYRLVDFETRPVLMADPEMGALAVGGPLPAGASAVRADAGGATGLAVRAGHGAWLVCVEHMADESLEIGFVDALQQPVGPSVRLDRVGSHVLLRRED